ncbi:hypothetical protein L484_021707 [Morus notabilis]|uniref:Uncharacterized protein n=1 Tax=Morus notabilis TaxID=981085 RepID=W9SET1_9ROSA|nr:hypothetical protein L484_021707 [Morus notabilis]
MAPATTPATTGSLGSTIQGRESPPSLAQPDRTFPAEPLVVRKAPNPEAQDGVVDPVEAQKWRRWRRSWELQPAKVKTRLAQQQEENEKAWCGEEISVGFYLFSSLLLLDLILYQDDRMAGFMRGSFGCH